MKKVIKQAPPRRRLTEKEIGLRIALQRMTKSYPTASLTLRKAWTKNAVEAWRQVDLDNLIRPKPPLAQAKKASA